jgi:hypothetical protein
MKPTQLTRFYKRIHDAQRKYIFEQNNSVNAIRNHAVPHEVITLWYAIMEYGDSQAEIGGEGNSGEFHDEKEAQSLESKGKHILGGLIKQFSINTGWKPVWIKVEDMRQWVKDTKIGVDTYSGKESFDGFWRFEYVRPWRNH